MSFSFNATILAMCALSCGVFSAGCNAQTTPDTNPQVQAVAQLKPTVLEPYGVGSHWNEMKYYALAKQAGIQWIRLDISWNHVQPESEQQWDLEKIDKALDEAKAQNLKVLAIVGYTNPWASDDPSKEKSNKFAPPAKYTQAWQNYIEKVVSRYKDRVEAWEIWNEPDHGGFLKLGPNCWAVQNYPNESPVMQKRLEYKHLIDLALEKMKEQGVKVTNSGFARGGRSFDDGFVEWLRNQDNWFSNFDIINYHSYCWPKLDRIVTTSNEFRKLAEQGGKKAPLWITEHGITEVNVPDDSTKSYLLKSYAVGLAQPDVEKFFWFRLTPGGDHMTLLNEKGQTTAAYDAYATLTKNWPAPVSVKAWDSTNEVRGSVAILQSGKKVALLWSEPKANAKPSVHVNELAVTSTEIFDQDGNQIALNENPVITQKPLFVTLQD